MKIVRFVLCCALALLFIVQIVSAQDGKKSFVENELLVKFKSGTASRTALTINSQLKSILLEEFPASSTK